MASRTDPTSPNDPAAKIAMMKTAKSASIRVKADRAFLMSFSSPRHEAIRM
jgi:hypothetical protein